ncbi:MAG: hypothetical protein ACYC4L_11425 [Chloroflexota bacterium]
MNELNLTPLGDIPQTEPGQTVYVSLAPFVIPWWAWAIVGGLGLYVVTGGKSAAKQRIWRRRRLKAEQ